MEQKNIYCIRHGTALHNINYKIIGEEAYNNFPDTPLVNDGVKDAHYLALNWDKLNNIDLVLVSPLSRTLQTADIIFKHKKIPIIVLDELLEYPQSEQRCNLRKNIRNLSIIYNHMDFSNIKNDETCEWNEKKLQENIEINKLKIRIENLKKWIDGRTEKNIAIVGHSSYFNMMLNGIIDNETNELEHCHPYEYSL